MSGTKPQCKDIPDEIIVESVSFLTRGSVWTNYTAVHHCVEALQWPGKWWAETPWQLVRAKLYQLDKRDIVHACCAADRNPCGGNIHIPEYGSGNRYRCWC
jgi:hypothetical protein